jgi:transcriptional regulator with XRE-family HTH domain
MNSVVTLRFIKCHDKLREDNRIRSSRQFAMALDYLPQSLSEVLKGRRDVTIELLRKAVEKYKISPVFLFCGEGPMFLTEDARQDFRVLTIVANQENDERIVHVPVPAQAGYATEINSPSFVQELPTYTLPDYKYKIGTHRSFDVAGDSMEPTLFEGDKVVCSFVEPSHWESSIKPNYVYVIVTRGDVVVKRITKLLKEEKKLELSSDNAYYQPYQLDWADVREIWYVRARISPFLPSPQNIGHYLRDEIRELRHTIREQSQTIQQLNEALGRFLNASPSSPDTPNHQSHE